MNDKLKDFLYWLSDSLANAISAIIVGIILSFFSMLLFGYILNYLAQNYPEITLKTIQKGLCQQL